MASQITTQFVDAESDNLVLRHPTHGELLTIWRRTMSAWQDSLTPSHYIEESRFLTTVPLAAHGGMTTWILVHREHLLDKRIIYCSCESFRKRSMTSDSEGNISHNIVHGIASVFCAEIYRGRGYAARMMKELIPILYRWQVDGKSCVGTTLYSDIGRQYYARMGWRVAPYNVQIELRPKMQAWPSKASMISEEHLAKLCKRDERLVAGHISKPSKRVDIRFTIISDLDHLGWHRGKEEFATRYLFNEVPSAQGAIVGEPGDQMWALWTRRYYDHVDTRSCHNVLYILRLVIEQDQTASRLPEHGTLLPENELRARQVQQLKVILAAAQAGAAEWRLDMVKLWDPTPLVLDLLPETGLWYVVAERQDESLASLFWYGHNGTMADSQPLWVNNEHYAWQ